MKSFLAPIILSLAAILTTACQTTRPNAEFVGSVNFSNLETFAYDDTLLSGMDFRESEQLVLEEYSKDVTELAFESRGFSLVESEPDFTMVSKWRKAVSSNPNRFQHIDGYSDQLAHRGNPTYSFSPRMHLVVEVYETETGKLFWRNELPNVFDANEFTEERIVSSLRRAWKNFPSRVEKDPNLPSIQ